MAKKISVLVVILLLGSWFVDMLSYSFGRTPTTFIGALVVYALFGSVGAWIIWKD